MSPLDFSADFTVAGKGKSWHSDNYIRSRGKISVPGKNFSSHHTGFNSGQAHQFHIINKIILPSRSLSLTPGTSCHLTNYACHTMLSRNTSFELFESFYGRSPDLSLLVEFFPVFWKYPWLLAR